MIRDCLRLVRIQSIPLTISILSAGYMIETGNLLEPLVAPLLVVGALGHMGFYAMNEIYDVEWDREAGKTVKPLVGGDVGIRTAKAISFILISISILIAIMLFPVAGLASYLAACILGAFYNSRSKEDPFTALYLGIWAVSMLLTGYYYAGGV